MSNNTPNNSKVLSTKTVYQSKFFRVNQVEIERDGKTFTKDIIEENPIVVILPYTENGDIYISREYRDAHETLILNSIGGKIGKDEDPLDCAKREMEEEVGLQANVWRQVAVWERSHTSKKKVYVFFATDLYEGKQLLDEDESIELVKLPVEKAIEKIMQGEIVIEEDIATIFLFDKLKKEGKV